ncbi:MAG: D-alanine--D-alanine ligase [Anaerolineaceae bacterium]|nr:D-alanine--D-alanine ligase [Anaerolineaceae bacterium]
MTQRKINLAVLFGGRSGEHEVSLESARSVFNVLSPEKYNVIPIGITHEGLWLTGEGIHAFLSGESNATMEGFQRVTFLNEPDCHTLFTLDGETIKPLVDIDVVFPMLHGTFGEDGTLQGFFEMAGFAYVGAGVLGSAAGMDKALFKDVMRANHIPVVTSIIVSRKEIRNEMAQILDQTEALTAYPIFTKPANLGSSVGISKCKNRAGLLEGIMEAARFDRRVLIEKGIDAREIEISVLGNEYPKASLPGEVIPCEEFYSYDAKYVDDDSELIIPAPLPFELQEELREVAVRAYKAIDCAGMARVDFLVDKKTGEFYLNEVNTIPGFTSISMYPKLWEATGLPYATLVDELIQLALDRKKERDETIYTYEG